jgi:hypothetical protein
MKKFILLFAATALLALAIYQPNPLTPQAPVPMPPSVVTNTPQVNPPGPIPWPSPFVPEKVAGIIVQ